jgi:hypothetical protein
MIHDYFPELDGNQSIDNGKMGRKLYKGGGGGGSSTTIQSIDPAILPYITYGLGEAQNLYKGGTPEYYPGQTYVDPSAQTTSALGLAETRATAGNPLLPAAQAQQLNTIQGGNLGNNPYFSNAMRGAGQVATQQFQDALQGINSQASQAGRYGSNAMADLQSRASTNLANSLVNKAGELGYQNYATERGIQENAIANAPALAGADYADINQLMNVGKTNEAYAQQALQGDIARYDYNQNAPYNALNSYLSAAYGAPTPMNQTTTQSGGGK